ncbi:hypothetical protein BK004_03275 [bacterium CG10_46_32]|nr:MAG: hypothetical protein BK004_03275 [bacterium CG10_46_32]
MLKFFNIKQYFNKQSISALAPKRNQLAWAVGLVLLFFATFYGYYAIDAYRNARQIASLVEPLKQSASNRDWDSVREILSSINANTSELESAIDHLYPFTELPIISREVYAARSLIAAAKVSVSSAESVVLWLQDVPLLSKTDFNSFSELSEKDKSEFLESLADSAGLWGTVASQMSLSLKFLEDARSATRFGFINFQINSVTKKLVAGQTIFSELAPWIGVAPRIVGYPGEKTYLLLLQNNTELRPTGGFIGTYGILKVRNASVTSFMTDNVYNLDEPAKAYNQKVPPAPLQRYIKQSQWFFRDSNWDPDFSTSAQQAIQFYKDERGPVQNFDGVIALTPTFVQNLMAVLGPVTVDGKEFTTDNLIETLAYHVELGFKEEGITIYNRKQIIDDVAQQLKEKLFNLSVAQMQNLAPIAFGAFSQKQLMVYFADPAAQALAEQSHWANRIISTSEDYFYVVDSNLGSLKSDPAIHRSISYSLTPSSDGKMNATVAITYKHIGGFDWKTTRYRTYTRVYVPRGSSLITAKGNEEPVAITDEHNKTVFGTFISIEPGTTETLTFTYALPKDLASRIAGGHYSLYIQKQGGTVPHDLMFDITVPFKINGITPNSVLRKESANRAQGAWSLAEDRIITLTK